MVQPPGVRFVQRLPSPVLVGAAIVGIVAVVVLVITRDGDDGVPAALTSPTTAAPSPAPSPPSGVRAERFAPEGLGVTMQVPSTWSAGEGEEGYDAVAESPDGSAFVLVDRRSITGARDRVGQVERLGASVESERTVDVDGFDAQVLVYESPFPGRGIGHATEVDVDLADGTYAIVVVAAVDGSDVDPDVLAWIVETVRVAV